MNFISLDLRKPAADIEDDPAEYVGYGPRLAARVIDYALHLAVGLFAGVAGGVLFLVVENQKGRSVDESILMLGEHRFATFAVSLLGMISYGSIAESLHGSTLGKRLLGVVVLRENKTPCGILAAVGRQLAFFIDSILFGLVGAYAMSGNRREQRYGDQWFRTVVIRRRTAPQENLRSDLRLVLVLLLAVGFDGFLLLVPSIFVAAG